MLNAERFKKEILDLTEGGYYFAVRKDGQNIARSCDGLNCEDCIFDEEEDCGCSFLRMKWMLSEYREPVKLSRLEYEILKWAKKEGYKYIDRTSSNSVFVHANKPNKLNCCWVSEDGNDEYLGMFNKFFQFVKWEDSEPTSIQEVLNNCEVVEDAEE